jgi:hypothetical protein
MWVVRFQWWVLGAPFQGFGFCGLETQGVFPRLEPGRAVGAGISDFDRGAPLPYQLRVFRVVCFTKCWRLILFCLAYGERNERQVIRREVNRSRARIRCSCRVRGLGSFFRWQHGECSYRCVVLRREGFRRQGRSRLPHWVANLGSFFRLAGFGDEDWCRVMAAKWTEPG